MKLWKQIRKWRNSKKYKEMREDFLSTNPLCAECLKHDLHVGATDLDHIEPVIDNPDRMFDPTNFQGLCKECHKIKTTAENRARYVDGRDEIYQELDAWVSEML